MTVAISVIITTVVSSIAKRIITAIIVTTGIFMAAAPRPTG